MPEIPVRLIEYKNRTLEAPGYTDYVRVWTHPNIKTAEDWVSANYAPFAQLPGWTGDANVSPRRVTDAVVRRTLQTSAGCEIEIAFRLPKLLKVPVDEGSSLRTSIFYAYPGYVIADTALETTFAIGDALGGSSATLFARDVQYVPGTSYISVTGLHYREWLVES